MESWETKINGAHYLLFYFWQPTDFFEHYCLKCVKDFSRIEMCKPQWVPSPFVISKLVSNNLRGKENAGETYTPTCCRAKTKHVTQSKWCMPLMWLKGCRKTSGLSEAHLPKMETMKWLLGNKTKRRKMCVPRFPSKLTNATMTARAVTAAVPASSPAQTCASRPAPANKSHNTKHESGLTEESSFQ